MIETFDQYLVCVREKATGVRYMLKEHYERWFMRSAPEDVVTADRISRESRWDDPEGHWWIAVMQHIPTDEPNTTMRETLWLRESECDQFVYMSVYRIKEEKEEEEDE